MPIKSFLWALNRAVQASSLAMHQDMSKAIVGSLILTRAFTLPNARSCTKLQQNVTRLNDCSHPGRDHPVPLCSAVTCIL